LNPFPFLKLGITVEQAEWNWKNTAQLAGSGDGGDAGCFAMASTGRRVGFGEAQ
jgi:hypothetical protein